MANFILDDNNNPVICESLDEWAAWFSFSERRHVAFDIIDGTSISTVFLSVDHNFGAESDGPILYETMTFNAQYYSGEAVPLSNHKLVDTERRYRTRKEALAGHAEILNQLIRITEAKYRDIAVEWQKDHPDWVISIEVMCHGIANIT